MQLLDYTLLDAGTTLIWIIEDANHNKQNRLLRMQCIRRDE